jgi:Ca-activated chloride channel family protein
MELDEIKYLYLLFIASCSGAIFLFNAYGKKKKQREFGDLEAIQLLSPDRSVLNLFLSW